MQNYLNFHVTDEDDDLDNVHYDYYEIEPAMIITADKMVIRVKKGEEFFDDAMAAVKKLSNDAWEFAPKSTCFINQWRKV